MGAPGRIDLALARRGGARELLRLPAVLFAGLARLRAVGYERRWLPAERVDAPVVSVGNLSAGGTGKTPCVAFLARELLRRGWRPGILARGHGARRGDPERRNDESLWLAAELPEVERLQEPDRAAGARALIERGADVVLLDDGFQHRRLQRDLDLVLLDATRPWGLPPPPEGGAPVRACLPRGLLREPPGALARADALVLTRANQVQGPVLEALRAELAALAPGRPILAARHRPSRLRAPAGHGLALGELAGREVELLSAIGNPGAFESSVRALGAHVALHRMFPDHHVYRAADLAGLGSAGRWVVTTEKDAVKLTGLCRCHVLGTDFELVEGQAILSALLDGLRPGVARRARAALHEGLHG